MSADTISWPLSSPQTPETPRKGENELVIIGDETGREG